MIIENLEQFIKNCKESELKTSTVKKYKKDIEAFIEYSKVKNTEDITKDILIDYKKHLQAILKTSTLNNKLVILNKFIIASGLPMEYKLKQIKVQKKTSLENVLSKVDYERLLRMALRENKTSIYYLMQTLAGTGIRANELQYITVENVKQGVAKVENKGKIRNIVISKSLAKDLKDYCTKENITTGVIFKSKQGNVLDKAYIWREIQKLAGQSKIKKAKAHAHSFRHLFAKSFMSQNNNVVLLADLLGHSSLETTRIYTQASIKEQRDSIENLY